MKLNRVELNDRIVVVQAELVEYVRPNLPRWLNVTGSNPDDADGIVWGKPGQPAVIKHVVVHDVSALYNENGGTVDHALIYNVGWGAPDRVHGLTAYTQGTASTPMTRFVRNVLIKGFGDDVAKFYASGSGGGYDKLHHYTLEQSIVLGGIYRVGAISPTGIGASDVHFIDNTFLRCQAQFGYIAPNFDIEVRGNVFDYLNPKYPNGVLAFGQTNSAPGELAWQSIVFTGNTVISRPDGSWMTPLIAINHIPLARIGEVIKPEDWNHNTYYAPQRENMFVVDGTYLSWDAWRKLGYDADSTFVVGMPDQPIVRVYPIPDLERAYNVAVINPQFALTVPLPEGMQRATVRFARDYFNPVAGATDLDMIGTVAALEGIIDPEHPVSALDLLAQQGPYVAAFLLEDVVMEGQEEEDVTPEQKSLLDLIGQLEIDPALVGQFVAAVAEQDPTLEKVVALTQKLATAGVSFDRAAAILDVWGEREAAAVAEKEAEAAYAAAISTANEAKRQLDAARTARQGYDDQISASGG